ncbi:MAG: cation:proton antiporter [Actinomycetaceae bacterium]|nr:cation:proton antiporter [Actinomycetaceae bacterium]
MTVLSELFIVVGISFLAPLISKVILRGVVPEVVLLLIAGTLIGPHVLGIVELGDELRLLRELGVAFLFLLAGFEIDPKDLQDGKGAKAGLVWLICLILAFLVVSFGFDATPWHIQGAAVAIAMTSTAIGTLLPVLKDRNLTTEPVGKLVLAHGAIGEMGPVVAMALLLSYRATWASALMLVLFVILAVMLAVVPRPFIQTGSKVVKALHWESETTAQATVRLTVLLLVGLCALAASMGLDLILGAFAAGFILRQAVPAGREELEQKLDGIGYGLLIPIFFTLSGAEVDPSVLAKDPWTWLAFFVLLMAVRGVPVLVATFIKPNDLEAQLSVRQKITVAIYSTTALPIIVAVTHIAVSAKAMSAQEASTLVIAGTASVLVMPLIAFVIDHAPAPKLGRGHGNLKSSMPASGNARKAGKEVTKKTRTSVGRSTKRKSSHDKTKSDRSSASQ